MPAEYMSVDQVAAHLHLHVRTVRAYVRKGRLKAIRIGKQYRITPEDLEAFTGRPVTPVVPESIASRRHVDVTVIVHVDAINAEEAQRLKDLLRGTARHWYDGFLPTRSEAYYDRERARMRIVLMGDMRGVQEMLNLTDIMVVR